MSSIVFSSLLWIAVNSALPASSGDENVLWPGCCAADRMDKQTAKRTAITASLVTLVQANLSNFSSVRRILHLSISNSYELCRETDDTSITAALKSSASTTAESASATEAVASTRRKASGLTAMIVPTEGIGAGPALIAVSSISLGISALGVSSISLGISVLGVSSSCLAVSVERSRHCPGVVVDVAVSAVSSARSVEIVAVVKSPAHRVVPGAAIDRVSAVPIESPVTPPPSKAAKPSDSEAESEREIGTAKPNAGVGIPSRPRINRAPVNQPRIVRGNINDIGASRLNDHRRTLRGHSLLRSILQVAGVFRALAHNLYGIHHILLLVVVSIAKRRRP